MTAGEALFALAGLLSLLALFSLPALVTFRVTRRPVLRALSVAIPLTPAVAFALFALVGLIIYGPQTGRGLYSSLALNSAFMTGLVFGTFGVLFFATYFWARKRVDGAKRPV